MKCVQKTHRIEGCPRTAELTTDERKNKSRRDVIVRPRPQITTIVESIYCKQSPVTLQLVPEQRRLRPRHPRLAAWCSWHAGPHRQLIITFSLSPHLEDHQSSFVSIHAYVHVSNSSSRYHGRIDRSVAVLLVLLTPESTMNGYGKEVRTGRHCGKFASSNDAICATQR